MIYPIYGKTIKNITQSKPVTQTQVKAIADGQIFLRQFKSDYNQVLKRISSAPNGLRTGGTSGQRVGF